MKKVVAKSPAAKKPAQAAQPAAVKKAVAKSPAAKKPAKAARPAGVKKAVAESPAAKKPAKAALPAGLKGVYAKALLAAGYAYEERADRLIFTVSEDTFFLMVDEQAPERFALFSGFALEKIKYPVEIFEEMNLTMQTTPYVRVYSEPAGKKGEIVVLFEICQLCLKSQIPLLLKSGVETITRAMEMFGDMN